LARFFYRKALSLKPGNTVASAKLEQSEKALQGDKKAAGDSEFEKNIQLGNQEFKNKNYGVARNYYKQALALNPNDSYAKDQLTKIETLLKNQQ
jgi:tetratricopeptide (TPR) repeat protein